MSKETMSYEDKVRRIFPEAKLLTTVGDGPRHEAYLTIHGDWTDGAEEAWKSLADKLGGRTTTVRKREPCWICGELTGAKDVLDMYWCHKCYEEVCEANAGEENSGDEQREGFER